MQKNIEGYYNAIVGKAGNAAIADLQGDDTSNKLAELVVASRTYLFDLERFELLSKVEGKSYFMFVDKPRSKTSRPVNKGLYLDDLNREMIDRIMACDVADMTTEDINKVIYTCAISYCCAIDLLKDGDRKSPGTYFEFLIGHLIAKSFNVNPVKQITAPSLERTITVPTDYVFNLGHNRGWIHLPIKTSTRERGIQVWAHQALLDGMHGVDRFKGMLVALAETNKKQNRSVEEVCIPQQWASYQMFMAKMSRVYYLDPPKKYLELNNVYPFIKVKTFGEFFKEVENPDFLSK